MVSHGNYIVITSFRPGNAGFIATDLYSGYFYIRTYNSDGTTLTDKGFSFVVYRK